MNEHYYILIYLAHIETNLPAIDKIEKKTENCRGKELCFKL